MPPIPSSPSSIVTVSNVEILAVSRRYETSSEAAINYRNIETLSFQCFAHDITNDSGVLSDITSLIVLRESTDYYTWIIDGRTYERCKLTGFDTIDGDWTNLARVTIELEIIKEGQDALKIGSEYQAIFSGLWEVFESIDEKVELSRGPNSTTYTRTIDIKLNRILGLAGTATATVDVAKNAIKSIMDSNVSGGYNYDTFLAEPQIADALDSPSFYKQRKESHNLIENTVSITETIETSNVITDQYGHSYVLDVGVDENGILTVSEKGRIEGLVGSSANKLMKINSARSFKNAVLDDAKDRMEAAAIALEYIDTLPLNPDGGSILITQQVLVFNEREGWIDYELTSTNDPNANGHSYSIEINKSECNSYGTENGSFVSTDIDATKEERYASAKAAYYLAISTIDLRIKSYITCLMSEPYQRSETHDLINGRVDYSRSFTDDPVYDNGLTVGARKVKKYEIQKSSSKPIKLSADAEIPGVGVVEQVSAVDTEGQDSLSISMLLERIAWVDKYNYHDLALDKAKEKLDDNIDSSFADKITNVNYSWAPLNDVVFTINSSFFTSQECQ